MKSKRLNILTRCFFIGIFTVVVIFLFGSCTSPVRFLTSSVVPAAQGDIKLKMDKNKNYAIQIKISDMADVTRLQPSKRTYVVWMITDQGLTKNIGQLNSTTSLLSKRHKAELKTVSSFKPAKVFITAEDEEGVQNPGTQVVLSTDKFPE
jgi:hypothetical protein